MYLGTDTYDAVLIEVTQGFFTDVRDITRDNLRPQLSLTNFCHVIDNVDTGENIIFDQAITNNDGIFKVVTAPGHKGDP